MSLMDELERRRFLNTLRSDDEFRATVRRELLTQELLDLPHTVAALVDAVDAQERILADLQHTVATLVDVLAGQVQILADHGQILADHGRILADHGRILADQGQTLADHGQTLAALVDAVAGQRQDFIELVTAVRGYMERTITLIGDGFSAVDAKFAEQRADFDAKFYDLRADMDRGFAAVDARFDQVHGELAVIKDQLAS
jgi:signal transduction histidine kinase